MPRLLTRFQAVLRAPFYIVFHGCSILHGRDKPAACFYGDAPIRDVEAAADLVGELATDPHFVDYRVFRLDPATGTFSDAKEVYDLVLSRMRDSYDTFAITTLHEHIAAA